MLETEAGEPLANGGHVKLGDLVRVRLFVYTEKDNPPFIALRDRFGGGLEPLDANLDTSPQESLAALLGVDDLEVVDGRAYRAAQSIGDLSQRTFEPRVATFYVEHGGTGLREYTYGVRASTPGTFVLPPAELTAMYQRGFEARSTVTTLVVDP